MEAILFGWPYAGLGLATVLLAWICLERRPAANGLMPLAWGRVGVKGGRSPPAAFGC
jgi:hypothetical protein